MLAKLRLSSHSLQIEMGRRNNIPREQRRCHCREPVEDELHFLLRCPSYDDIRVEYAIPSELSVQEILSNGEYISYIEDLWQRRKYKVQRSST